MSQQRHPHAIRCCVMSNLCLAINRIAEMPFLSSRKSPRHLVWDHLAATAGVVTCLLSYCHSFNDRVSAERTNFQSSTDRVALNIMTAEGEANAKDRRCHRNSIHWRLLSRRQMSNGLDGIFCRWLNKRLYSILIRMALWREETPFFWRWSSPSFVGTLGYAHETAIYEGDTVEEERPLFRPDI